MCISYVYVRLYKWRCMYMEVLFPGRERPDWACLLLSSAAWRLVRAAVSGLILVLKPWLGFSVTARSWFGLNALNASLILCLVDIEQNANSLWAAGSCKGKRLVLACTCTCMLVLTLLSGVAQWVWTMSRVQVACVKQLHNALVIWLTGVKSDACKALAFGLSNHENEGRT
jgi:hypothetical protein